jgi:hypothetical protein
MSLQLLPIAAHSPVNALLVLDGLELLARSIHLHVTVNGDGGVRVQPTRDDEAANSPGPNQHSDREGKEQCGDQKHEGDADPEEREDQSRTERKCNGGQGKGGEEEERQEGECSLRDGERLCACITPTVSQSFISS